MRTAYRKRTSRKAEDRIVAVQFNGFQHLFTDRTGEECMPRWMPEVDRMVFDAEGTYDTPEIERTPAGEIWRLGDKIARFGIDDGHLDCHVGDFIVRYHDGHIAPLAAEKLKAEFRPC